MSNPRVPRARYSLLIIFGVGVIDIFLWSYRGWNPHNAVLAAGLFLDILGASILAIPDIPSIQGYFFSGKVRNAIEHLKLKRGESQSILVEPGTEDRLVDSLYIVEKVSGEPIAESSLMENARGPEPSTEGFYELREAFYEGTNDSTWHQVFGFKVYEGEEGWRTYILYNNEGNPDVKLKSSFHNPCDKIIAKLERSDARFRRMGLSLLIGGFLFQGFSILV
jgi:hypothetical protein